MARAHVFEIGALRLSRARGPVREIEQNGAKRAPAGGEFVGEAPKRTRGSCGDGAEPACEVGSAGVLLPDVGSRGQGVNPEPVHAAGTRRRSKSLGLAKAERDSQAVGLPRPSTVALWYTRRPRVVSKSISSRARPLHRRASSGEHRRLGAVAASTAAEDAARSGGTVKAFCRRGRGGHVACRLRVLRRRKHSDLTSTTGHGHRLLHGRVRGHRRRSVAPITLPPLANTSRRSEGPAHLACSAPWRSCA